MTEYPIFTNDGTIMVRAKSRGAAIAKAFSFNINCNVGDAAPASHTLAVIRHADPMGDQRSAIHLLHGTALLLSSDDIAEIERRPWARYALAEGLVQDMIEYDSWAEYATAWRRAIIHLRTETGQWLLAIPCGPKQYERTGGSIPELMKLGHPTALERRSIL